jgi:CubicO group peptidase (beta-lactamase class C family)
MPNRKKIIKYSFLVALLAILIWVIHYAWVSFPIISGFGAKQMCSCMFISGRTQESIDTSELGDIPFTLGTYNADMEDSSVTGSIWGMAKKKAIYRKGIGCTLINDITEKELRAQTFNIPPPPLVNADTIAWPYGDRIADTILAGMDTKKLNAAVDWAFTEHFADKKTRTRAVVVVYNRQLVAEKYAKGFDKNTMMYGWSMAKSFTAALTGILVNKGNLDITKPAPVEEWSNLNDPRHAITIKHLLQQTSGLDYQEDYTKASSVTNMLFKKGDMAAYIAALPLVHTPGTAFNYSGGNSNILSRIIRQTLGERDYAAFPFTELFYKIGMYHTLLEPDASGTYVGSSYIMATARDFARFGLLYCNDGIWNNERILPEGWVKETTMAPAANNLKNYGYQFWLNGVNKIDTSKRIFPNVPADMFYCDGYGFQDIYIIPSKKLVVVRLGLTLDKSFDENAFLKNIIDALK